MRRSILLGLALGAGLAAAAAHATEIRFIPGDRFTSVGGSPLALLAGDGSAPLDRRSLDELAGQLTLETWPEGKPVAGRAQVQALDPDWTRAQITFSPAAALTDRWYRLHTHEEGVRFRTGSQLVVRRLRACREGQDLRLDLTFSERVREWRRDAVTIRQGGAPLSCEPVEPVPPAGEAKELDLGAGEIAFHCELPSSLVPIDIALGRTLVSLGGVALGGPEETLAYRVAPIEEWTAAGGCTEVKP